MTEKPVLFSRTPVISYLLGSNATVKVFASTLFAYVIAIIYESSYLNGFGVGPEVIEITPVVIFYSLLLVIAAYLLIELYVQLNHYFLLQAKQAKADKSTWRRYLYELADMVSYLIYTVLFIMVLSGAIATNSLSMNPLWTSLWLFGVMFVLSATAPFLVFLKSFIKTRNLTITLENYHKRIDEHNAKVAENEKQSGQIFNERFFLYVMFILFALILPINYGTTLAKSSRDYYVWSTSGKTKILVVKNYGATVITKKYDTQTRKFMDGYAVAKIEGEREFYEKYKVEKQN